MKTFNLWKRSSSGWDLVCVFSARTMTEAEATLNALAPDWESHLWFCEKAGSLFGGQS